VVLNIAMEIHRIVEKHEEDRRSAQGAKLNTPFMAPCLWLMLPRAINPIRNV
jgi:hypothetical protein